MKTYIFLVILFCLSIEETYAQQVSATIKGQLKSEKTEEALPDIVVRAVVNRLSVASGKDGSFQIQLIKLPDTLTFSHVGYETKKVLVTSATGKLSIKLKHSTHALDEVVINTGYQTVKPNEANGAVVAISNKTLNQQAGTNILKRLEGITSGLSFSSGKSNKNPQNTTNITIRGLSTINGTLDPLIVLDNFIYEGDIKNINPNDVENITVLKDAAAASIWGARAGNGVIVITTKKGKFNQPLQIGFNADVIVSPKPDLFQRPQMSAADYIDLEEFLFNRNYFNKQILSSPFAALTPAVEVFLKRREGLISKADSAAQISALKQIDGRKEYDKYFYKKALTQQYALQLQGGGSHNSYSFSVGQDFSSDELYNKLNKTNLRADNTFRPTSKLTLTAALNFTQSQAESGRPAFNSVQIYGRQPNYLKFKDENGDPLSVPIAYRERYTDTAGARKLLSWKYYPTEDYKHNTSATRQQEIYAIAGLNYKLTNFLNIDLKYQYQKQISNSETFSDLESYRARDLINSFSQLNRATKVVKYIIPPGGIRSLNNQSVQSQTTRAQLNFNRSWNDHDVSVLAGGEARQAKNYGDANTLYGYYKDPLSSAIVDHFNTYPNFITGNYQTISNSPNLSETVYRFVSFYSTASYGFKKRYVLTGSIRKDGSNIFGANTNDKWKPLWSAGLGWNVSEESFYKLKWLPNLKLVATYGHSGNVDLSRSALPVAVYATNPLTNFRLARISTINNPELRWEQSAQLNFRAEFSFANQKVTGSIDYYRKKGTDLYGQTPYDYTAWGNSSLITKNVASMVGEGFDVILQSRNIDRIFKWNTSLLFNYYTDRTTAYYTPAANVISSLLSGGKSINPVVGKPLYAVAAYKWGGLSESGHPQGYLDGALSIDYTAIRQEASAKGIEGNVIYKGSASPQYFGSIINSFTWKRFSASINIGYKFGYYLFKPAISYRSLIEIGAGQADYEKRWQKPGDENHTNIPSFIYPNISDRDAFFASSEVNVIKGDHIRLNYINLDYDLSAKKKLSILPFSKMQIYTNISNLGILWRANKDQIDPDNVAGIPVSKAIAIGIRSNF